MSAADVIAEDVIAGALDAPFVTVGLGEDSWATGCIEPDSRDALAVLILAALSAAGYVVATPEEIRAWPVEQVAELIGGEVGERSEVASIVDDHELPDGDLVTGLRLRRFARVIGPEVQR